MKYEIPLTINPDILLDSERFEASLDEYMGFWAGKPNTFEVFKNTTERQSIIHFTGNNDIDNIRCCMVDYRNTYSGAIITGYRKDVISGKLFILVDADDKFDASGLFTLRAYISREPSHPTQKIIALDYIKEYEEEV